MTGLLPHPGRAAEIAIGQWANQQSALCVAAIDAAERRHGIPMGLLQAIAKVESGRPLPPTGALGPWPWTTDANGAGALYDTKERAMAGAAAALRRGGSLDVGCVQVNLHFHPGAFTSLEQAFDPDANADYAARYLVELRQGAAAGDWHLAAGFYHSQSPALAAPYRARVDAIMAGLPMPRGGPPLLFTHAVQRGVLVLENSGDEVRVVRIGLREARRIPDCKLLPGGAVRCSAR